MSFKSARRMVNYLKILQGIDILTIEYFICWYMLMINHTNLSTTYHVKQLY